MMSKVSVKGEDKTPDSPELVSAVEKALAE